MQLALTWALLSKKFCTIFCLIWGDCVLVYRRESYWAPLKFPLPPNQTLLLTLFSPFFFFFILPISHPTKHTLSALLSLYSPINPNIPISQNFFFLHFNNTCRIRQFKERDYIYNVNDALFLCLMQERLLSHPDVKG